MSEPQTPIPPAPEPAPPGAAPPPATLPRHQPRRPRGKIARLAPPVRERLNQLIDEGLTYSQVIEAMGEVAQGINEVDLCRWYKSGFQDWLRNQLWLEQTRSRLDLAIDVIAEHDGSNIHQANLYVAATQLIQDLIARGEDLLKEHPDEYVELVNSITRLSREGLSHQKYREACAQARAELSKLKDRSRKLSEEETLAIVDHVDRILGFK